MAIPYHGFYFQGRHRFRVGNPVHFGGGKLVAQRSLLGSHHDGVFLRLDGDNVLWLRRRQPQPLALADGIIHDSPVAAQVMSPLVKYRPR